MHFPNITFSLLKFHLFRSSLTKSTYSTSLRQLSGIIKGLSVKQKLKDSLLEQYKCLDVS